MIIRSYEPSDLKEVLELNKLALEHAGTFDPGVPWESYLEKNTRTYLAKGGCFLVGVLKGQIVAMGALKRTDTERAEIKRMRFRPDLQRRGLGETMLQHLESRARRLGYRTLHLGTTTLLKAAQRFYVKHGYKECGRRRVGQFDMIMYEKRIGE